MTTKTKKFRFTRRLVAWIYSRESSSWRNSDSRLPSEVEEVFFNKKETPSSIAKNLATYAAHAGRLPARFEELLKADPDSVARYINSAVDRPYEDALELLECLKGRSQSLFNIARVHGRLPEHLELSIDDPDIALSYAKSVIFGRLPPALEEVFFKDTEAASSYAFDVIRGFSPCRLPDHLHAFMVMKSFEDPDDSSIKDYIAAADSNPNKSNLS